MPRCRKRFAEIGEELLDARPRAIVSFSFAYSASNTRVVRQADLPEATFAQPRCIFGCGDELCAGQIEVALARAFLGQPQTMTEFQFCSEEVGFQPRERIRWHRTRSKRRGQGPGDQRARAEYLLVILAHADIA